MLSLLAKTGAAKAFLFVAFLNGQTYVLDSNMTADDCMSAVQEGVQSIEVKAGQFIASNGAKLACVEE